jgi:hypothetical protein
MDRFTTKYAKVSPFDLMNRFLELGLSSEKLSDRRDLLKIYLPLLKRGAVAFTSYLLILFFVCLFFYHLFFFQIIICLRATYFGEKNLRIHH